MTSSERLWETYEEKEHQPAYVFDPTGEAEDNARPTKRRRVSKKVQRPDSHSTRGIPSAQRLFRGAESEEAAGLRLRLFEESWARVDSRVQSILRDTNQSTLHQVTSFLQDAPNHTPIGKVPSAFIVTGPSLASQDLLFEQLSDTLQEKASSVVVRLRSSDAANLRTVLKKIIRVFLSRDCGDDDEQELSVSKEGRGFLNYDLEALHVHFTTKPQQQLAVIAFQDSEAFDSALLSDLISLLSSWLDRIPFAFLFGVATSVELFEARLLKSTCQSLYGDQFDVEQAASIIDKIFKAAVAHSQAPIRLGPSLVGGLLERQREQVASIPDFVKSLKYAYMCHFYANPLAILLSDQHTANMNAPEHMEMIRYLPSFRFEVTNAIKNDDTKVAQLLLDDDEYLLSHLQACLEKRHEWTTDMLRALKVLMASNVLSLGFADLYMDACANGIVLSKQYTQLSDSIKRMQPSETEAYLVRLIAVIETGDPVLGLDPWGGEIPETMVLLSDMLASIQKLCSDSGERGHVLRSKYSGQGKILRTTVVAQKVQLSHDTAALTDEDDAYTNIIHQLLSHLETLVCLDRAYTVPFNEIWLHDSKMAYKDVFVPRPRATAERALTRSHDYLGCSCCKSEDQIVPNLPTTAILYQLYLETGSLINAADLWSAYYAIVGEDNEDGLDERAALVLFYRALAELKAMGFVKQSRKKADHMAKIAWKGL
ncbi:origin recognition complex subunit 3 N-terminus-domain-containing protein [Xylariaceae sp. FL1019]|nr:origin recognition complex subunit 3 N-terminus-domain-containing protein [Xylariaceae sp. FL1019]